MRTFRCPMGPVPHTHAHTVGPLPRWDPCTLLWQPSHGNPSPVGLLPQGCALQLVGALTYTQMVVRLQRSSTRRSEMYRLFDYMGAPPPLNKRIIESLEDPNDDANLAPFRCPLHARHAPTPLKVSRDVTKIHFAAAGT